MSKTLVQEQFGKTAAHYLTSKPHAVGKSLERLVALTSPQKGWRVLDVATGGGHVAYAFAPHVARVWATDITQEMLDMVKGEAAKRGLANVRTTYAKAEALPFEDESFDLVFGHAVLHHIPDLERALAEFKRVLRPGGAIAFCGEPSRYGDRLAAAPKRAGMIAAPAWRRLVGASPRAVPESEQSHGHSLEGEVDVHAFAPADLRRLLREAELDQPRVGGEELLANAWGWGLRTVESTAEPESVSWGWRRFAFNSYIALQKVDTRLLEPRLPAELFYNLVLSGRKPT